LYNKFVFLIIFCSVVRAVNIPWQGLVIEDRQRPLENAVIINLNSGDWTLSDEWGIFRLPSPGLQDTVVISRYGYYSDTLFAAGPQKISILLLKNPLKMDRIQVTNQDSRLSKEQSRRASESISSISRPIPALALRSYGGQAGVINLSLDGGPPTHTKILFEGVDLTSSQNGETDLSQIPPYLIERLSFSRSAFLSHGSGAVDGALQLNYGEKSNQVELRAGSFAYKSAAAAFAFKAGDWSFNSALGQTINPGKYPVGGAGQRELRKNNDFDQTFFMGKIKRLYNKSVFISASLMSTRQKRGVAGSIISQSPAARRNDNLNIFSMQSGIFNKNNSILTSISRRYSRETYINPQFALNSRHEIENFQFKSSWERDLSSVWKLKGTLHFQRQGINSSDLQAAVRNYRSIAVINNISLSPRLDILLGSRLDQEIHNYTENTWQALINFKINKSSRLTFCAGNAFRYPTFNDFYWVPGGNPDLEPEFTDYAALELIKEYAKHDLSFRYSHKSSRDLIQWAPSAGNIWSPVNLNSTRRETFTLVLNRRRDIYYYRTHLSYFKARDLTAQKRLIHTPEIIFYSGLGLTGNKLDGFLSINYTGRQISYYSWPQNVIIPSFTTVNFELQSNPALIPWLQIILNIENLFNQYYYTIKGYPEPGRNFKISIIIKDGSHK